MYQGTDCKFYLLNGNTKIEAPSIAKIYKIGQTANDLKAIRKMYYSGWVVFESMRFGFLVNHTIFYIRDLMQWGQIARIKIVFCKEVGCSLWEE